MEKGYVGGFLALSGSLSLLLSLLVGGLAARAMEPIAFLYFVIGLIVSLIQLGIARIIENQKYIINKLNKKEE